MPPREVGAGSKQARKQKRVSKAGAGAQKRQGMPQGKNTNRKNTNRCRKRGGGKKPICLFVITAVHPDSLYFQIEQNSLFTHQWQAGRKKRNGKRPSYTQPRR